jgi:rod shape-determining protein MreC
VNILGWLRKALTVWNGVFSFILALVFSGVLLSLDNPGRLVFHQVMTGTVLYPVQATLSNFDGTLRIYRENERLTRENAALRAENDWLREARLQVPRLEDMARFQKSVTLRLKPGKVIAQDAGRFQSAWVIDLGSIDSVTPNMPVLTSRGVVGKIVKVYRNHSLVQLLSDHAFKVSVQSSRSRARGILESDGPERLVARFPAGSDVARGDSLTTTGLGGVFPKGLRVGAAGREVTRQEKEHQDVIRTFQVAPFQELNTVEEIFVLIKTDQWMVGSDLLDTAALSDTTRSGSPASAQSRAGGASRP